MPVYLNVKLSTQYILHVLLDSATTSVNFCAFTFVCVSGFAMCLQSFMCFILWGHRTVGPTVYMLHVTDALVIFFSKGNPVLLNCVAGAAEISV